MSSASAVFQQNRLYVVSVNVADKKSNNMADKSGNQKKTFEFRMSKKVAELTQVVHMLFTRNHEREVEIEALKDAYENEIDLVIKDARSRIEKEEAKLKELEKNIYAERDKFKMLCENEMKQREIELHKKIDLKDQVIQEEKQESQKLRDMLINAQRDIEKLRQGVTDEMSSKSEELDHKIKEIAELKRILSATERKLKDSEKLSGQVMRDMQDNNEKLLNEISQLKEIIEDNSNTKESLIARNKQLETDMKNLKRELARKFNELANQNSGVNFETRTTSTMRPVGYMDYHDELERLRREVQRYKMELFNREGNFNRMFADKQQVVVDNRAGRIGQHQQQLFQPSMSQPVLRVAREKTVAYAAGHSFDDHEERRVPSRATSAMSGASRLPPMHGQLGVEQRSRFTKLLMKPRPPPKEMLSGK